QLVHQYITRLKQLPRMKSISKTALVTGSSRGIGLGIAKALAASGFNIILNAPNDSEALQHAVQSIVACGAQVKALIFDVGDIDQHATFMAQAKAAFGDVHCLVNNAGI